MKKTTLFLLMVFANLCLWAQDSVTIKIHVNASSLPPMKNFGIRGSLYPLNWDKTYLLDDADRNGIYEGVIRLPFENEMILEYKYVYGDEKITWELERQNRILLIKEHQLDINDTWNINNGIDVSKLPKISSGKLLDDLRILKMALKELHPGLYRYKTKQEIDSIFAYFDIACAIPQSYQQAFLNFTRLTAAIQCGHTFPNVHNQHGLIREVVLNQRDKLPFAFRVIDEKMIITSSVANTSTLTAGTEILAIDGIPTKTILAETAKLVKADGSNDNKRYSDLNTFGFGDNPELFDCYFPLLYPPANSQYHITFRKPGKDTVEQLTVHAVTRKERNTALEKLHPNHPKNANDLWKLEFWDNETAYLQLGTFAVFQLSFDWRKFLKNAFAEINKRNIQHLVIDIRWNEGGQDEVLLTIGQYIVKKDLSLPRRLDLVRYNRVSPELRPYLFTWDSSFYDLTRRTKPYNQDYYLLSGGETPVVKSRGNGFKGNTYLLVNAANSSATFYLAEIAKENKLATLIGETTGGSQQGLNGGMMFFLRLPNTGIEIDIPIVGSFSAEKPQGGIQPDVTVRQTVADLIKNQDKVIEETLNLIKKHR